MSDNEENTQQWFFDLASGTVSQDREGSYTHRMGPYASRSEAESALEIARLRTEKQDAIDEKRREEDEDWGVPASWEKE